MATAYPDVIKCRAPRPVNPVRCPAPPWKGMGAPAIVTPSLSPDHLVGNAELGLQAYKAKQRMLALGRADVATFVQLMEPLAQPSDEECGLQTWIHEYYDDYKSNRTLYLKGRADVYVVESYTSMLGEDLIRGTFVPIHENELPAIEFFGWRPEGAGWFEKFSLAWDRMPKLRERLKAAFTEVKKRNLEVVFSGIRQREATGKFPAGLRPITSLGEEETSLLSTNPHPRIQYGLPENENHLGKWFARLGDGWFVRDRSCFDVAYVYVGDDGVRYADGNVLQDVYGAYPELWYEPLDSKLQPQLFALADNQGESQEDAQYEAIEARLMKMLGRESREISERSPDETSAAASYGRAPPFAAITIGEEDPEDDVPF